MSEDPRKSRKRGTLVPEAYLKMVDHHCKVDGPCALPRRGGDLMRQILVDHAERKSAAKRDSEPNKEPGPRPALAPLNEPSVSHCQAAASTPESDRSLVLLLGVFRA